MIVRFQNCWRSWGLLEVGVGWRRDVGWSRDGKEITCELMMMGWHVTNFLLDYYFLFLSCPPTDLLTEQYQSIYLIKSHILAICVHLTPRWIEWLLSWLVLPSPLALPPRFAPLQSFSLRTNPISGWSCQHFNTFGIDCYHGWTDFNCGKYKILHMELIISHSNLTQHPILGINIDFFRLGHVTSIGSRISTAQL